MHRYLLLIILLVNSACYVSDEVSPDQEVWEYSLPSKEGLSGPALLNLNELIKTNEFQEINGLIIIKDDKLVFENYYYRKVDPQGVVTRNSTLSNRNQASNIGNAGLVFALSALGVADDKRLLSLDDPIADYLPAYADVFNADPDKGTITIKHLITHRSGFAWTGLQQFDAENDVNQMKLSSDWVRYVLEKPLAAPVGLQYNFNIGSGLILTEIIENASGQDFDSFLEENILTPLTISSFAIDVDPQGNFNSGDGVAISLLDWTKLGYLYLNEGTWEGRRIIDPNFIAEATSLQNVVSGTFSLGYFWQVFGDDFSQSFGIPHDEIYFTRGGIGQQILIIPEENMIVSIFAENFFFGFVNPSLNLFAEITNTFQ